MIERLLYAALFFLALSCSGSDLIPALSSSQPGPFHQEHPCQSEFDFGWALLKAGSGSATIRRTSAKVFQMDAFAKTIGAVRSLFHIDAEFHSSTSASTLRPIHVHQREVYSDESIETDLAFDPTGVVRRRYSSPENVPDNGKPKHFRFQPVFDPFSAYLWIRSQTWPATESRRLVVYACSDPYLVEAKAGGIQALRIGGPKSPPISATRIDLKFQGLDRKLQPAPYRKCRKASVWISNDSYRRLLRAEAEIFVGKIWLELRSP
jgi:hypothetical protein